jgi:two-component system NarL family sensor kinase
MRRIVVQLAVGVVLVLAAVTIGGTLAARRLAEREAVNDAASIADVLADAVVQPSLTDQLLARDPAAISAFDKLVQDRILKNGGVVRVKLWGEDGTILYSDQPELIGEQFPLDAEEREVLHNPRTIAEISDLSRPENALDRDNGDKLVEVYRPVWTPSGGEALFEIYAPYDAVSQRTGQLWRGFAGVTLSSLLLFMVLLAPLLWHLLRRVRRAQRQRVQLLERAVDASSTERRRIAATLHDGPVQDLAATSFVIAGASAHARANGQNAVVAELGSVSASVRTSIRALRSLLVDIYPASLAQAGLGAALADLAQSVRAQDFEVRVDTDDDLGLEPEQERLVYRVAQETLRNAARHAAPCTVTVTVYRTQDPADAVVLDVVDDGTGFDVASQVANPDPGHFGLQVLADIATTGGALLQVASAPGSGTHWRLQVQHGSAPFTEHWLDSWTDDEQDNEQDEMLDDETDAALEDGPDNGPDGPVAETASATGDGGEGTR